jgi:hypothetical protein
LNNDDARLKKLSDLFIQSSNISDTPEARDIVEERCSALLYSSAHQWRMEGLLSLDENDQLVKSSIFKRVWDNAVESATFSKSSKRSSKRKRQHSRSGNPGPSVDGLFSRNKDSNPLPLSEVGFYSHESLRYLYLLLTL